MVQNRKQNTEQKPIESFTFPWAREWARWASEQASEVSCAAQANEWAVRANGRSSDPVLKSVFLIILAHSASAIGHCLSKCFSLPSSFPPLQNENYRFSINIYYLLSLRSGLALISKAVSPATTPLNSAHLTWPHPTSLHPGSPHLISPYLT